MRYSSSWSIGMLLFCLGFAPAQTPLAFADSEAKKPLKWQWILTGWEDLEYPDSYEDELGVQLDILDVDFEANEKLIKAYLKNGTEVICYMSVGTYEEWRSDLKQKNGVILEPLNSGVPYSVDDILGLYDDEFFIDIGAFRLDKSKRSGYRISYKKHKKQDVKRLQQIMRNRIKIAARKGCSAVEFDNMDIQDVDAEKYRKYKSKTKGNLTGRPSVENQVAYVLWLSDMVHRYGMDVVLKNSHTILDYKVRAKGRKAKGLAGFVDARYIVVEECTYWGSCGSYNKIAKKHRARVLAVEYTDLLKRKKIYSKKKACKKLSKYSQLYTLIKDDRDLIPDGYDYYPCR